MTDEKKPDLLQRELLRLAQVAGVLVNTDVELKAAAVLCGDVSAMIKTVRMFRHLIPAEKHPELDAGLLGRIQVMRNEILPTLRRLYGQLGDLITKLEALKDPASLEGASTSSPE